MKFKHYAWLYEIQMLDCFTLYGDSAMISPTIISEKTWISNNQALMFTPLARVFHMYIKVIPCMHMCIHISLSLSLYIYIYIYVYTHTYTHTYIYIYIYIQITKSFFSETIVESPYEYSPRARTRTIRVIHLKAWIRNSMNE